MTKFDLKAAMEIIPDSREAGKVLHLLSDIILTGLFTLPYNGQETVISENQFNQWQFFK